MKSGPRKILPFWKRKSYWPKFPNHRWVRCDWSINFISVPFYILMNSICSRYAHLESRHHETLFDGFIQKWRQMLDQIGLIWHHSFAEGLYLYFNRPFCRKKSLLILNPDQVGPETPSRFFVTIKVLWRLIRVMGLIRVMARKKLEEWRIFRKWVISLTKQWNSHRKRLLRWTRIKQDRT